MYSTYFKPILDFIVALILIVALSPLLLLISIILTINNQGGTPFFLQYRPGKEGQLFKMIKFKTMTDAKDAYGDLLPDAQRLTRVGKFMRKTSLDELPQLVNVLRGEMSLIGPRPLLPFYLDLYNDFQKRRNEVKPGITGWAQVNGRNNVPWKERFELDVWYVDHISFILDVKILWLTVLKVLSFKDVNENGQATSQEFKGNDVEEF